MAKKKAAARRVSTPRTAAKPRSVRGYGWTRNTVKVGETISCTGGAAKSGAPSMISSYMKLADGRMMKS